MDLGAAFERPPIVWRNMHLRQSRESASTRPKRRHTCRFSVLASLNSGADCADTRPSRMTTLAIDTPVHAFGSLRDADGAGRDFHSWELHSELVLVCPDLRERSLELLLEPASPAVAKTERQTDVSTSLPAADSPAEASAVLRYAVRRVGE